MLHGSAPNHSLNNRTAQFLRAFPRASISRERLLRRAEAISKQLDSNQVPIELLGLEGISAFGLEIYCK